MSVITTDFDCCATGEHVAEDQQFVAFELEISSLMDHTRSYVATLDEAVRVAQMLVKASDENGVFMVVVSGLDSTGSTTLSFLKPGQPWRTA